MYTIDKLEGGSLEVVTPHPNVTLGSVFSQTNDLGLNIPTAETRIAKTLEEGKTFKGMDAETGWMINFRAKLDSSMAAYTVTIPNMAFLGSPTNDVPFVQVPGVLTQLKAFDLNYQQAAQAYGDEAALQAMAQQLSQQTGTTVTTDMVIALLASCPDQDTIDVVQRMVDGIGSEDWTYFTFWFSENKEAQATTYYKIFINHGLAGGVRDSQGETVGQCPWIAPLAFNGSDITIGGKIGSYIKGNDVSIPFIGEIKDIGVFNQSFGFDRIAWLNQELAQRA